MIDIESLIGGAAADAGLPAEEARAALIAALGLLHRHAEPEPLEEFYAAVPGAQTLAGSDEAQAPKGGGLFGGLMKSAGGVSGKAMADAVAVLEAQKKRGLEKDDLKRLLPAARARVTAATGRDYLGEVIRSVPGVGPLLGGG